MLRTMDPGADQVYGVRKVGTCYYLLSIITDQATDLGRYGISRDPGRI